MRLIDYYIGIPLCFVIGMGCKFRNIFRKENIEQPSKILLVKTWGMGNIVLMLPSMKALREAYPKARIFFLSLKNNKEMLQGNPYIDDYFLFDMSGPSKFLTSIVKNLCLLRQKQIDCVLDFDQFVRFTALYSFLVCKKRRIGFDTKRQGKKFLLTDSVIYNNSQHMSKTFYDLIKILGIKEEYFQRVKIAYSSDESSYINNFLKKYGINTQRDILIGMHVGCSSNFPKRRWSIDKFARLADRLIINFGAKIYFTGTEKESKLVCEVMNLMKNSAIDTSGKFPIRQLSVLIEKSDIFFSSDTGPLHVASAMGTPVVGFYGPNTPLLYGPLGENNLVFYKKLPCSPCITNYNAKTSNCDNPICIESIEFDEVYNEVVERILLNNPKVIKHNLNDKIFATSNE